MQKMWNPDNNKNFVMDYKKLMSLPKNAGDLIDRHRKKVFAINVAIIILVVLVVIVIAFTNLPWYKVLSDSPFAILGSFASVFALVITLILLSQLRLQAKQLDAQAENSRKQMSAEQFKNAIDHLGNEKQAVVLGGVHALHNLAMTFPKEYSQQVFEVLCSFIREETRKPIYQKKVMNEPVSSKNTQQVTSWIVIQTIVDKLFREKFEIKDEKTGKKIELYRAYKADLSGAFLRGVDFMGAILNSADLLCTDLQDTNLADVNLQEAELFNAKLQGTNLMEANLQGTNLRSANLHGTVLWNADLQGATLIEADLQDANLWKANLQETDLTNANLQGAYLPEANLQRANLTESNLEGINLKNANLQGARLFDADLQGANLSGANLQGAYLSNVNLQGADLLCVNFQGALLTGVKLQKDNVVCAFLQGVHSDDMFLTTLPVAIKNGTRLPTILSGITLYATEGHSLNLTEDEKKAWFSERGAYVDDLSADEVQKLSKSFT